MPSGSAVAPPTASGPSPAPGSSSEWASPEIILPSLRVQRVPASRFVWWNRPRFTGVKTWPTGILSVNEIFLRAIEAGSPSERAAVLDRSCGDDAELRRKVEALLFVHDGAGSFLEHPSPGVMAARAVTGGEAATLPGVEPRTSSHRDRRAN